MQCKSSKTLKRSQRRQTVLSISAKPPATRVCVTCLLKQPRIYDQLDQLLQTWYDWISTLQPARTHTVSHECEPNTQVLVLYTGRLPHKSFAIILQGKASKAPSSFNITIYVSMYTLTILNIYFSQVLERTFWVSPRNLATCTFFLVSCVDIRYSVTLWVYLPVSALLLVCPEWLNDGLIPVGLRSTI